MRESRILATHRPSVRPDLSWLAKDR